MNEFASKVRDLILDWFPLIFGFGILAAFAVWFIRGIGQHRREREKRIAHAALEAEMKHFVYAKIMDPVLPMKRASKYEEPLEQALETAKLGVVTGGETQMAKGGAIAWVGIDIALADLDGALQFTRQRLRELGAPPGSELQYRVGEQKMTTMIS